MPGEVREGLAALSGTGAMADCAGTLLNTGPWIMRQGESQSTDKPEGPQGEKVFRRGVLNNWGRNKLKCLLLHSFHGLNPVSFTFNFVSECIQLNVRNGSGGDCDLVKNITTLNGRY